MKKIDFPVGKKVRGYGLINEFGEFDFIPEQTGIKAGQTKLVRQGENYTLSSTKNCLIVHLRLDLKDKMSMIKEYLKLNSTILDLLRDYDF